MPGNKSHKLIILFILVTYPQVSFASFSKGIGDHFSIIQSFFSTTTHTGKLEGSPPSAAVYQGKHIIDYAYYTDGL